MNVIVRTCVAGVLVGSLVLPSTSARSNFFRDIRDVVTDPIGLRKSSTQLSDTVERTLIQLRDLEHTADAHVKERLEQIRSILREALSGTEGAIAKGLGAMIEVESRINQDALRLIYRAQCAVSALQTELRETFAKLISDLKKANPGFDVLGVRVAGTTFQDIIIDRPDQAFASARDGAFAQLTKNVTDKSRAFEIFSTYQNLIRSAQFARCHYIGEGMENRLVKEINELRRLSEPWIYTIEPKMFNN